MNKYRVRLFSVFVVCMILVFCVLGCFYSSFLKHLIKGKQRNTLKKKQNTWLRFLMPAI